MARARNAQGRFVKGAGRKAPARGGNVALTVYESRPPARRGPASVARSGGGGGGAVRVAGAAPRRRSAPRRRDLMDRARPAGIASLIGYVSTKQASTYEKIPTIGKIPREAVIGLAAHYFSDGRPGLADDVAQAALDVAGYKLGAAGYAISGDDDFDDID